MAERPRWRVNTQSHVGHALVEEGTEVFYTPPEGGEVAENLSPINDAAQAIVDEQKGEHPDKTSNAKSKAAKAAKVEETKAEDDKAATDGPVKNARGDTRTAKEKRADAAAAAKAAKTPPVATTTPEDEDLG